MRTSGGCWARTRFTPVDVSDGAACGAAVTGGRASGAIGCETLLTGAAATGTAAAAADDLDVEALGPDACF